MCYNYIIYIKGKYLCEDILRLIHEYYTMPLDDIDNKIDLFQMVYVRRCFGHFQIIIVILNE